MIATEEVPPFGDVHVVHLGSKGLSGGNFVVPAEKSRPSDKDAERRGHEAGTMSTSEAERWRIDPAGLKVGPEVGRGRFGVVRAGDWLGTRVALKSLFLDRQQLMGRQLHVAELFERELGTMARLSHPNIVQYLGYAHVAVGGGGGSSWTGGCVCLVLEYMPHGSVEAFVRSHSRRIGLAQKLKWMEQMALALAYLHNRTPCFLIHSDVKPANFLLSESLQCKLSDFGVSHLFAGRSVAVVRGGQSSAAFGLAPPPPPPPLSLRDPSSTGFSAALRSPFRSSFRRLKTPHQLLAEAEARGASGGALFVDAAEATDAALDAPPRPAGPGATARQGGGDGNCADAMMEQTFFVGTLRYMAPEVCRAFSRPREPWARQPRAQPRAQTRRQRKPSPPREVLSEQESPPPPPPPLGQHGGILGGLGPGPRTLALASFRQRQKEEQQQDEEGAAGGGEAAVFSPKADVFSAGLTFYFLLEGVGPRVAHVAPGEPESAADHVAALLAGERPVHTGKAPFAFRRVVDACLRQRPQVKTTRPFPRVLWLSVLAARRRRLVLHKPGQPPLLSPPFYGPPPTHTLTLRTQGAAHVARARGSAARHRGTPRGPVRLPRLARLGGRGLGGGRRRLLVSRFRLTLGLGRQWEHQRRQCRRQKRRLARPKRRSRGRGHLCAAQGNPGRIPLIRGASPVLT